MLNYKLNCSYSNNNNNNNNNNLIKHQASRNSAFEPTRPSTKQTRSAPTPGIFPSWSRRSTATRSGNGAGKALVATELYFAKFWHFASYTSETVRVVGKSF